MGDAGTVGVIGTGTMGSAMVRRLLQAGHGVVVHDAREESARPLVEAGAQWADSPAGVATRCRVVLTSVPGPVEAELVAEEMTWGAQPGDVHLGHSTVSIESARRIAKVATAAGQFFVDAPVSGGAVCIERGTLSVLASGDPSAIAKAQPFMSAYAGRVLELGTEPGMGTLAKLVNNAIFLCSGLVHQEAVVLATKAGMDASILDEVLAASSASMYLGVAKPTLARAFDDAFFTVRLAEKDVALALETARSLAVPMPVTNAAHQHYLRAIASGLGGKAFFATLAAVEAGAGVEVPARAAQPKASPASE
jgi:3-hydroxyisobutyrate dehydrogenase-like beta-hydroxyacid dehydrogenase